MGKSDEYARFRAIYRRHYADVVRHILYWVRCPDEAQDIAAATFLTAWKRMDSLPAEPDTRRWLITVARNQYANHSRAKGRYIHLVGRLKALRQDMSVDSIPSDLAPDGTSLVMRAFATLSPTDQEVLRLVVWLGLDRDEVARQLNCSRGAVDTRFSRARRALERAYDRLGRDLTQGGQV